MTRRRTTVAAAALGLALLAACTADPSPVGPSPIAPSPVGPSPTPAPATAPGPGTGSSPPGPGSTASAEPAEPTTTNTLPAPPPATAPAPTSAGNLDAAALPVPAGWRTVALAGGEEEGFRGNGTWVHARDPRYAAQDVITIGCADVTRDDYPDPVAALEGNYTDRSGAHGVGLALEFADAAAAARYWDRYTAQVRACEGLQDPVRTEVVLHDDGLVDRRTYPDGEWTEVARQTGTRVTLVILGDEGHAITTAQSRALLAELG